MIHVLLAGAAGSMGRTVAQCVREDPRFCISAGIDIGTGCVAAEFPVFPDPSEVGVSADVLVDFSHPDALESLLTYAVREKMPAVIATTGLRQAELDAIRQASRCIPVFRSENMSVGINLMAELVRRAAAALEDFDIEIVEKHHNRKEDAPSGTALMLAGAVKESLTRPTELLFGRKGDHIRQPSEIGIHSIRCGTVAGEHEVLFAGHEEILTVSHQALSREVFARGALRAAAFVVGKPAALYNMNDLIHAADFA